MNTVRPVASCLALVIALSLAPSPSLTAGQLPTPEAFFGFRMGADGELVDWPGIERYFRAAAAAAADRVRLVEIGPSTGERRLIAAIISAPENIGRLEAIRASTRRLADPRALSAEAARAAVRDQKVVLAIAGGIHAREVGATQMAIELLHDLATSTDPSTLAILSDVVVVLIPSLNPDGHAMVVEWFKRNKATPFAGGPMPWLAHAYADEDLGRDAFMMNLAETRAVSRFFYAGWQPHVFLSLRERSEGGARMAVPPGDGLAQPNSDPLIWREAAVLGQVMALELERRGRSGVVSNVVRAAYGPGDEDSAPVGHNVVCLRTEVAAAPLAMAVAGAAPDPAQSAAAGTAAPRPRVTDPSPWPGGPWRPRDVIDYELDAARGLLAGVAAHRTQLVEGAYTMAARAVDRGRAGSPYAFVIPPAQQDPNAAGRLMSALLDGGVEVQQAQEPFSAGGVAYPAGTTIVMMAQPFRAYAKTVLEKQDAPPSGLGMNGLADLPATAAGWTLPFQLGVKVDRVDQPFDRPLVARLDRAAVPGGQLWGERRPGYYVVDARGTSGTLVLNRLLDAAATPLWLTSAIEINGYWYPAGSVIARDAGRTRDIVTALTRELGVRADGVRGPIPSAALAVARARVGLYKPWIANADEGWTRFVLEQYRQPFRSLSNAEIRQGGLRAACDVIVLPDMSPRELIDGQPAAAVPPEYSGGLGDAGVAALKAFVEGGGTLVCLGSTGHLAIERFSLPVRDVLRGAPADQFSCPGSVLRVQVDTVRPPGFGMARETGAFFDRGAAFDVERDRPGAERVRVVARYADQNVLMSGWLTGEAAIAGRAAVVEVGLGAGKVLLFGIRPQHRGQSLATFRLLLNALVRVGTSR